MVHPLKKVEVSIPPASQGQWIDLAFIFPCMAILFRCNNFKILKVLAPRLQSAVNSSCSISYPRSKNCVCSASALYKRKSSANLSLSLGFNRCPQNKVDFLGLAQNRAIVNNSSLRLSEDLLVTLQSKTDTASPLYGPLSFTVLQGCSQQVSRLHPADAFPISCGTNIDFQM